MKYHQGLALVLFLTAIDGALAGESADDELLLVYGDKDTISIATGGKQTLRRAPSVASVITAEDIAAMGAIDLDEVLESVPGMHVSRTNSYSSTYVVRGMFGGQINPQILMLQNGIPLTTLYRGDKGGNFWGDMPLENVARIEIIRGPGSALYGADAFFGVINIITRAAADSPGTELGVRAGSFNSWNTWARHGGKAGALDVAAYVRLGGTDGSKEIVTADAQTARDTRFGTHASLAPGAVSTGYDAVDASVDLGYDKWRFRAAYKQRANVESGAGVSSALDPVGKAHNERVTADLAWNDPGFARDWEVGVAGSFMYNADTLDANYQLSPPGSRFSQTSVFPNGMIGDPERYERQFRVSSFATYSGFANHSLRFGIGHDDLDMYKTGTHKNYLLNAAGVPVPNPPDGAVIDYYSIQSHLLPQRRKNSYLYIQDEWTFARDWALTAGVRRDDYSDFGATTNPRVALVWDARYDLTAKLLYGQAFRAPSFTEQYGINPVSNGNPDLKPESIRTLEAAFAWQARLDTQVNLSFFRYEMDDIIRTVANTPPSAGGVFQNTGKQHGDGMELEATWDASRTMRLTGHYSYQQSIDEATGKDAGYAPHHHLYARADWRYSSGWFVSTQLNHVADRRRAAGDNRPQVPDFTTVDVTVRNEQRKSQWGVAASVRNLFDAKVIEPSLAPGQVPNDYPTAPRSFWLQATYRL